MAPPRTVMASRKRATSSDSAAFAMLKGAMAELSRRVEQAKEDIACREEELLRWEMSLQDIRRASEAKTKLALEHLQRSSCHAGRRLGPTIVCTCDTIVEGGEDECRVECSIKATRTGAQDECRAECSIKTTRTNAQDERRAECSSMAARQEECVKARGEMLLGAVAALARATALEARSLRASWAVVAVEIAMRPPATQRWLRRADAEDRLSFSAAWSARERRLLSPVLEPRPQALNVSRALAFARQRSTSPPEPSRRRGQDERAECLLRPSARGRGPDALPACGVRGKSPATWRLLQQRSKRLEQLLVLAAPPIRSATPCFRSRTGSAGGLTSYLRPGPADSVTALY